MTGAANRLSEAQRLAWLRLLRSENVGPRSFRELVNHFGGAEAALGALPELARRGGRAAPVRIAARDDAEGELERIEAAGGRLVAPGEAGYPPPLCHVYDAPPLLCIKGRAELAETRIVAIVGARNASALGRRMAALLARDLGERHYVIASGLARGVDTAAHEAALEAGTIAVVAGGVDVAYPPENEALQARIGETGLLISEMPPGTQPGARHFPRRNRLISGIARAVAVVEAARRSGSLITTRLALEQGREVFSVPGSPLDPRYEGSNRLIREGATLTRDADDIIEVLEPMLRRLPGDEASDGFRLDEPEAARLPEPPSEDARATIVGLLGVSPTPVDEIIRQSGAGAAVVTGVLLELELAGRLIRHRGQSVSLAPED